jgi:cytochrome c-type biogenesis protein
MVLVAVPMSIGKAPLRGLLGILSFGVGLMITMTAYGAGLTYIGKMAGFDRLQHGLFFVGGTIALVFGLWLMKLLVFELPSVGVPAFVQRSSSWSMPFLTGICLGNWGIGCPDPAFYVLMVYVASVGDISQGALMSAAYAAGRSLPIVGLAVLGLLGINTIPTLMKRREGVERFFGWTLAAIGAFMLSDVLFGMWFDATWVHEAWNWTLSRINANFGEIRATDHFHVHGGPITGFLFFLLVGFLVPGIWLYLKGLARKKVPLAALGLSVALWLFFYLPPALVPDLADRFGRELRPAPVQAPEEVLPDVTHSHSSHGREHDSNGEHQH